MSEADWKAINALRVLAYVRVEDKGVSRIPRADTVDKANSGHPGAPMGIVAGLSQDKKWLTRSRHGPYGLGFVQQVHQAEPTKQQVGARLFVLL